MKLRKFQKEFLDKALAPGIDIAALSLPRGNGKSWLAAEILTRCLTPGDSLHQPGKEYVSVAASIEQARLVYTFIRQALEPTGQYSWIDSVTRLGATHRPSNTKLRVISSNAKTAMGLVNVPLVVADEPGSWETNGGNLMWDALTGAQGKPGSPLKIVIIGTLAPMATGSGHWWWDLIHDGSHHSTYVMSLQGDADTWDSWATIRKANPLTAISKEFRAKLLEERNEARGDVRLKSRFLSYRLNLPSASESDVLLTVEDWKAVVDREPPERKGRPIVGVDLGGGRAWSAATALWQSGRVEALAVAPGIPDLGEQERRDRVPKGTYERLYDCGQLDVATGLKVQPPAQLWAAIHEKWGRPLVIICDRFRLAELQDAVKAGAIIEPRMTRWSEQSFDIRALRKMAKDGPLSVDVDSKLLIETSLARSKVKNDDAGNVCMVKHGTHNTGRDDVSAALVMASGGFARGFKRGTTVVWGWYELAEGLLRQNQSPGEWQGYKP